MKGKAPLLFFSLAVIIRLALYLSTTYMVDDAFITFRYAENLAAGNGFVYNLGERVLGTSTPLFTLLIALGNLLGLSSTAAALLVNLIASGFTSAVLYFWARRIGLGNLSSIPALLYCAFPRSVICDICGMETGLFTLIVTLAFYLIYCRKDLLAVTVASFAAITRPEGAVLLATALVISLIQTPQRWLIRVIPALLIVGNWLLFSYSYFGSLVPNSVIAKWALYRGGELSGYWQSLKITLATNQPAVWILWLLFLFGVFKTLKNERLLGVIALWGIAFLAAFVLGGTHVFPWYPAPVYPLAFLLASLELAQLLNYFPRVRLRAEAPWIKTTAVVIFLVLAASYLLTRVNGLRSEMNWYRQVHIPAAEYLSIHARPGDRVLAEDIGYFGYRYRNQVIDRDGLVTPAAVPYNRERAYKRFADSVSADWVFIDIASPMSRDIVAAPEFAARYQLIEAVGDSRRQRHQLFREKEETSDNK